MTFPLEICNEYPVCPACRQTLPACLPDGTRVEGAFMEEHRERPEKPTFTSRCMTRTCRKIWDVFAGRPTSMVAIPFLCGKCAAQPEGLLPALDTLEEHISSDEFLRNLFNGRVDARCTQCESILEPHSLTVEFLRHTSLRDRLWTLVEKSAEVAVNDSDSLAHWLVPILPADPDVSETDFSRYLDFVRASDFDHFSEVLECGVSDVLAELQDPIRAARLLAATLSVNGQHIDEILDVSAAIDEVFASADKRDAFVAEAKRASEVGQESIEKWIEGRLSEGRR